MASKKFKVRKPRWTLKFVLGLVLLFVLVDVGAYAEDQPGNLEETIKHNQMMEERVPSWAILEK